MMRNVRFISVRRGVTLVELLVVIGIMLAITAVAIPMVRPMLEQRPVREAARAVSSYFEAAQIRARETGRPCGVRMERFKNQLDSAFTLSQVEVPAPYSGGTVDTGAVISGSATTGVFTATFRSITDGSAVTINKDLLQPNDLIQFNYQGPYYTITGPVNSGATLSLYLNPALGISVPWTSTASSPLPFQILRRPTKSAARPLQLPGATVVDLYASGDSNTASFGPSTASDETPVIVMFSPNGGVDKVYDQNGFHVPTAPIHFLIGQRARLMKAPPTDTTSLADDGKLNWQDLTNLWVSVFPRNGLVTVSENYNGSSYVQARQYATEGQSLGGR